MPAFKNHKKPAHYKNFFQNYDDHINSVESKLKVKYPMMNDIDSAQTLISALSKVTMESLSKEVLSHLYIFDALRDGHDYFDEVMGATVVPFAAGLASLGLAALAMWEAAQALAIKVGMKKDDHQSHGSTAVDFILLAAAAAVISAAIFIKSAISLVTRPIVTLVNGAKPQDENRFANEDGFIPSFS